MPSDQPKVVEGELVARDLRFALIAARFNDFVVEPLVRGASAEHPKRNRPGSIGLGLYIAREVARSHGGRIDVTSTQESGTAFTIHLPRHWSTRAVGKIWSLPDPHNC